MKYNVGIDHPGECFDEWNFEIETLPRAPSKQEVLNRGAQFVVDQIKRDAGWFLTPEKLCVSLWEGFYLTIPLASLAKGMKELCSEEASEIADRVSVLNIIRAGDGG